jgi:hypothetical protein
VGAADGCDVPRGVDDWVGPGDGVVPGGLEPDGAGVGDGLDGRGLGGTLACRRGRGGLAVRSALDVGWVLVAGEGVDSEAGAGTSR